LHEAGLRASKDESRERLKVRRVLGTHCLYVIHLALSTLFGTEQPQAAGNGPE
jgi:hypothetical protein